MYDKLLAEVEGYIEGGHAKSVEDFSIHLDCIIKIKTIKYMDLQTEILEASRRVSRN